MHTLTKTLALAFFLLIAVQAPASAGTATRAPFGALPDGRGVEAVTLDDGRGFRATVITYGAALQSLFAPGRDGRSDDIVLGFPDVGGYIANRGSFGATIGRYANRIAGSAFVLDGVRHVLTTNNDNASLHGGTIGFSKLLWHIDSVRGGAAPSVTLSLVSPHGDQGYPGALRAQVVYTLRAHELRIDYLATTDRPTIVSMTNHTYFNLAGEASGRSVEDHELTIAAERFLPVDSARIPTGDLRAAADTAFDFRTPRRIGERLRNARDPQILVARGYDHTYVFDGARAGELRPMARLSESSSGRTLEVLSDAPGMQFYSGNGLDGTAIGKAGRAYRMTDGVAFEPQRFPNLPNMPALGSARLDPGQRYRATIVYRLRAQSRRVE